MSIIEIISMLIALISAIIAYREYKFARNAAESEGTFKKPEISISYENRNIDNVFWAFPIPREGNIEFPLRYYIKNNGEKSANNIELFIRIPKDLFSSELEEEDRKFELDDLKNVKYKWMNDENDYTNVLVVFIKQILPKQEIMLAHYINIKEATSFESNCIAKSKDNTNFRVKINCEYGYQITLTLYQDNAEPISRSVCLSIIDTSENSVKQYFDTINDRIKKEYNKSNYLGRMSYYLDRMREGFGANKFILLECEPKDLLKDEKFPIYRVRSFDGCEGFHDPKGFVIPTLGIWEPIFSPSASESVRRQIREIEKRKHH